MEAMGYKGAEFVLLMASLDYWWTIEVGVR